MRCPEGVQLNLVNSPKSEVLSSPTNKEVRPIELFVHFNAANITRICGCGALIFCSPGKPCQTHSRDQSVVSHVQHRRRRASHTPQLAQGSLEHNGPSPSCRVPQPPLISQLNQLSRALLYLIGHCFS